MSSLHPEPAPAASAPVAGPVELSDLASRYRERVVPSRDRAALAAFVVAAFVALLVARRGSEPARGGALLGVASVALALAWARARERNAWADPARTIDTLATPVDPERAARAIRALTLLHRDSDGATSRELSLLHVQRAVRALPHDAILAKGAARGRLYGRAALALGVVAVALAGLRGFPLLEGVDVLFARDHEGPVPLAWLDALEIEARPPEYLHQRERMVFPYGRSALPRGTWLTVHGVPLHPGRPVDLRAGGVSVPFADDGSGRVVARWQLTESSDLRVVARFGDVTVSEAQATSVRAIADDPPRVIVEGAPREVKLAEVGVGATIPIKYQATDDHGIREVHLVLRSGTREERRLLARLDGETEATRGGHTLHAGDPFLKKSHVPVEVRVEAEDNDAVTGPKWGASEAIVIIPPEAGEPEALRIEALRKLRDALVDSLASRVDRVFPAARDGRAALAEEDRRGVDADAALLDDVASRSYAGAHLSRRLVALLHGQVRRLREAMTGEVRSPGSASHARLVTASERLVLVTDAILHGLGQRDAGALARTLADAADELVLGASQMRRPADRERGLARADGSVAVLAGGGRSLRRLGSLGRDLGEIVEMDLARVARAREHEDLVHAEIAASDLAARLKDPVPSFGSQGGSGGRAGSESGGGGGGGGGAGGDDDGDGDAEQAFGAAAAEVDKLARDHARAMNEVAREADEPEGDDEARAAREEGRPHAKAVRDATASLPSVGAGSDSWTNKGASAKEHAEAMAHALEEGDMASAVSSGVSALEALEEAKRVAQRERWGGMFSTVDPDVDRSSADRRLDSARQRLTPELKWAAEKLDAMKKRTTQKHTSEVARQGDTEQRLAERAGELARDGAGSQAMPGPAIDALAKAEQAAEAAAQALKRGDAEKGLGHQREAQQSLEAAREALGGDPSDEAQGSEGSGGPSRDHTDIPNATAHKGPEDFRRRVLEGLGMGAPGRQRDAVRRYAEGLLR